MSQPIKCFFLEPTDRIQRYLRRYSHYVDDTLKCGGTKSYHEAMIPYDVVATPSEEIIRDYSLDIHGVISAFPTTCTCGYEFTSGDATQIFCDHIYRRTDTGEQYPFRDAPAGAMFYRDYIIENYATWDHTKPHPFWPGPDGHVLEVRLPGGKDWCPDSRCSNCTLPADNNHRCWVRVGTPPDVDVSKGQPGQSCQAGGGSIIVSGWHGFLRNGFLVECEC